MSLRVRDLTRRREFLREVHRHAFWQVETRQFPIPMDQSEPNTGTLVERPVKATVHIKASAAVIELGHGAALVRRRSRKTDGGDGSAETDPLPSRSSRIKYYFVNIALGIMGPKPSIKTSSCPRLNA